MNWVFDHIQLIIVIASTIAWWLTQKKQPDAPPEDPMARPGRQPIEYEQDDSDAARQVRERMRRLREQRGLSHEDDNVPPVPSRPEPSVDNIPPVLRELMGIPEPKPRPQPVVPPPVPREDPGARMAAQMRELEKQRSESEATAAKVRAQTASRRKQWSTAPTARSGGGVSDRDFLATLRDPRSARRAIILREVLGKPIALR